MVQQRTLFGSGVAICEYGRTMVCFLHNYGIVVLSDFIETAVAHLIPGRLLTADAASSIAIRRIRRWVVSCDLEHECSSSDVPLPTRVLDIDAGLSYPGIKLIETYGQKGRYIALSHCWGQYHTITTTRATLARRKGGIGMEDIPKTFQDTVSLARMLHIRYIWIDSLCKCFSSRLLKWDIC